MSHTRSAMCRPATTHWGQLLTSSIWESELAPADLALFGAERDYRSEGARFVHIGSRGSLVPVHLDRGGDRCERSRAGSGADK